jgi:hypothetical protein
MALTPSQSRHTYVPGDANCHLAPVNSRNGEDLYSAARLHSRSRDSASEVNRLVRHIAALSFIFACTAIAGIILATTVTARTNSSDDQLKGHVASTWGSAQEQLPPTANFTWYETGASTSKANGKTVLRYNQVERSSCVSLDSTQLKVDLNLNHRQKGPAVVQHLRGRLRRRLQLPQRRCCSRNCKSSPSLSRTESGV